MRRPRILLVFPPAAEPAQPYASLPALSASLEQRGCEVLLADLNIETMNHLLSAASIHAAAEDIGQWVRQAEGKPQLTSAEARRYLAAAGTLAFLPVAGKALPLALDALRRTDTYASADSFVSTVRIVDRGLQVASAAHYPLTVSRFGFDLPFDLWRADELARAVECLRTTSVGARLAGRARALIRDAAPDVLGISLVYPEQLAATFLILEAAREVAPAIRNCLGGPTAVRLATRRAQLGRLSGLVDAIATQGVADLAELAGAGPRARLAAGEDQPTPAYERMELSRYWVPEPVLLLNSSRSCPWRQCLFCDVSGNAAEAYHERPIGRVVQDMQRLHRATGATHFMFGDLSVTADRLDQLSQTIRRHGLQVSWLCQTRLERSLSAERIAGWAAAGCRGLVFGLESASQRMLDRMRKGTEVAEFVPLIRRCAEAGISVNLQAFVGFPGETEAEARQTAQFLIDQQPWITSASLTHFKFLNGAAVSRHAAALGIRPHPHDGLDAISDYEVTAGLSAGRAQELAAELQADLRRAYPIIEAGLSWNAHALLLVSRNGPSGLRLPPRRLSPASRALTLRPGLRVARLAHHVLKLERIARPTAKASVWTTREETWTVLDPESGRLVPLDEESYAMLQTVLGPARATRGEWNRPSQARQVARLLRLIHLGVLVPTPGKEESR